MWLYDNGLVVFYTCHIANVDYKSYVSTLTLEWQSIAQKMTFKINGLYVFIFELMVKCILVCWFLFWFELIYCQLTLSMVAQTFGQKGHSHTVFWRWKIKIFRESYPSEVLHINSLTCLLNHFIVRHKSQSVVIFVPIYQIAKLRLPVTFEKLCS